MSYQVDQQLLEPIKQTFLTQLNFENVIKPSFTRDTLIWIVWIAFHPSGVIMILALQLAEYLLFELFFLLLVTG